MANAARFRNPQVPKQPGEKARFKVVSGPDKGAIFVITQGPVGIGRGEGCDMVLTDLKTSRLHAELYRGQTGWTVRDMGSSNGVRHNGKEVKNSPIMTGDTIAVGETIMEFASYEAGTVALTAPPKSLDAVQSGQNAIDAQKDRIKAMTSFGGLASQAVAAPKGPATPQQERVKRLALVGGLGLAAAFLLLPDTKHPQKKTDDSEKKQDETAVRDLASYLPKTQSQEVSRTLEAFFKTGFREYREGNYLRAKAQFETVLQIDPGHKLARLYLANAENAIDEEVKSHLELGRKSMNSGQLSLSKGHYEAVMRLLFRDPANPAYVEAKEQLQKVMTEMKGDG